MIVVYIIIGIILLFILLGFILPSAFSHEAEIIINKNKETVFEFVKSLKNQDHWLVWNLNEPEMKKEYTGTDSTIGIISA